MTWPPETHQDVEDAITTLQDAPSAAVSSTDITDATPVGRSVLTATDGAAARANMGAVGSADLAAVATSGSYNDLTDLPTGGVVAIVVSETQPAAPASGYILYIDPTA